MAASGDAAGPEAPRSLGAGRDGRELGIGGARSRRRHYAIPACRACSRIWTPWTSDAPPRMAAATCTASVICSRSAPFSRRLRVGVDAVRALDGVRDAERDQRLLALGERALGEHRAVPGEELLGEVRCFPGRCSRTGPGARSRSSFPSTISFWRPQGCRDSVFARRRLYAEAARQDSPRAAAGSRPRGRCEPAPSVLRERHLRIVRIETRGPTACTSPACAAGRAPRSSS